MFILINGVAQSPGTAFSTAGPSVVFTEAPKAPSRIKFREAVYAQKVITRMTFSSIGGIFPLLGNTVRGLVSEATATCIDSGVDYIDVIDIQGTFQINESIMGSQTGFNSTLSDISPTTSKTIFEQGERITNLSGNFAIVEENNLQDGTITNELVLSRTSGTAKYETGEFNIKFNDIIYSARSKIAATITSIAPYQDDISNQIIDRVDLSPSSSFFALVFQRVPSITFPNKILDNISETVINPVELYDPDTANNQDFLDFERVRNQEIRYDNLTGTDFAAGSDIRLKKIYFGNSSLRRTHDVRLNDASNALQRNARFIAEEAVGAMLDFYPSFQINTGRNSDCEDDIVDAINMMAWQLEFDGNSEVWDIANTYVQGNTVYHVDGAEAQTVWAMNKARDLAIQCIRMEDIDTSFTTLQQWRDLTVTGEYSVTDNSHADARALLLANKWYIAHEALYYAKQQNPGYNVSGGDSHCLSDIVDVIEAIAYNAAVGGNDFVWEATDRILHYGTVTGDIDTMVNAFTKARDIAIDVQRNVVYAKQDTSHGWTQFTDGTITADGASPACQAPAATITTLANILINALGTTASPGTRAAFQSGTTKTEPSTAVMANPSTTACVNVTSAITNYFAIITDSLQDPTGATPGTYPWSISNVTRVAPPYSFNDSETLKSIKHAYKDKSSGGFFVFGEIVKGITSGNTAEIIGSNAGNKWIYTKNPTGAFSDGEYITNSLLVNTNVTVDNLDYAAGAGSLEFSGTAYLTHPSTEKVAFGDGSIPDGNFTIELWVKATGVSGNQTLLDFRTSTGDTSSAYLIMVNNTVRWNTGNVDRITSSANLAANTWTHIAIVRNSGATNMYVGGTKQTTTYTDNTNYGNMPVKIGANAANAQAFTGNMENLMIKLGTTAVDYTSDFTPSGTYDDTDINLKFGFNGEAPIPIIKGEIYATFQQTITSTATAEGVELWRDEIMTEGVDLSRDDYVDCADIIDKNKYWIAEEAVGRMKAMYPDFVIPGDTGTSDQGTQTCLRDTYEYIIPAIIADLRYGGNFNSIVAARGYLANQEGQLAHVNGELLQSIYAWREVGKLCNTVITANADDLTGEHTTRIRIPNYFSSPAAAGIQSFITDLVDSLLLVLGPTGNRFRDGADLLYFNRKCIADEVAFWLEEQYNVTINFVQEDKFDIPGGTPGRDKCVRDLRDHIIPAIAGDLLTGGNANVQGIIDQYLDSSGKIIQVEEELLPMLDAIGYSKMLMEKALQNALVGRSENLANLAGTTAQTIDDFFQFQYTDFAAFRKDQATESTFLHDPQIYAGSQRALDAADMLETNKRAIAGEAVDLMLKCSAFKHYHFSVKGGKNHCEDDIVDVIEAIIHDLRFNSNSATYDAAMLYLNTENGLKHVTDETEETAFAMKMARDMSALAIQNKLGFNPYPDYSAGGGAGGGQGGGGGFGGGGGGQGGNQGGGGAARGDYDNNESGNKAYNAADEIKNNLRFIASTAVGRGVSQYPSLGFGGYGYQSCVDDCVDILEALIFNLAHGGNNKMWYATEFYVTDSNAVQHINGQPNEVKYVFEQARDIAIQVMRQQLVATNGYTEGDPIYDDEITIDQQTAAGQHTPTAATYDPATGDLVLTLGASHNVTTNDTIRINTNSLVFTCDQDDHQTQHTYPRVSDPAAVALLPVTNVSGNDITVDVGITQRVNFDAKDSTYDPETGLLTLDIGSHSLREGQTLKILQDELNYRCSQDNYRSIHKYPRATDPAVDKALDIVSVGTTHHTATWADFNPVTGMLNVTVPNHGFKNGDKIRLANDSMTFTCDMDEHYSKKTYPRLSDPASGRFLPISNVTKNTFEMSIGKTPIKYFTPSQANYDPDTGGLELVLGVHGLTTGTHIKLAPNSLTFTCKEDDDATFHTYPRAQTTTVTPTDASYNPVNGHLTVTVANHGFKVGEMVHVEKNGIVMTCDMDGNASEHPYPRQDDPANNSWMRIEAVSTNTFTFKVGESPKVSFTPTAVDYTPTTGDMKMTIGNHSLTAGTALKIAEGGLTFTCAQDSHQTLHPYPRNTTYTVANINNGSYDPETGIMTVTTASNHGLQDGDKVKFADGAITFTCSMDGNGSNHPYPRSTDPASGKWLEIDVTGNTTFTVNVGKTPTVGFAPTMVDYNPTTGLMTLTIGQGHNLSVGQSVRFSQNSLTFKCAFDNYATDHSYPRASGQGGATQNDPFYDTACAITQTTEDTITVQVLSSQPSTNTTAHTWQAPTKLTPTGASYNPSTGVMSLTVTGHGMVNGDHIKVDDNFVTFTCGQDSDQTNHAYPRPKDPVSGKFIPITYIDANTFSIQVLENVPSTNTTTHNFVSAVANSIERCVVRAGGIYTHAYVSSTAGSLTAKKDQTYDSSVNIKYEGTPMTAASGTTYSGTTGILEVTTSANHGLVVGDYVKLRDGAVTFTCLEDGNGSNHPYPRATDPISDKWIRVSTVPNATTFSVQVLDAIPSSNTTTHTFVSGLSNGIIKKDNTITVNVGISSNTTAHIFKEAVPACITTGGNYTHTFVRAETNCLIKSKDPVYGNSLEITGTTATSITLNVLPVVPSTNVTQHTFISATNNCVTTGGNYSHKFISAEDDGVELESGSVTVNVGTTPAVFYSVGDANYDGETGDMMIKVGAHKLIDGTTIKIADEALTFTCDMDSHASEHVYPRLTDPARNTALKIKESSSNSHTITGATYTPTSGVLTATINSHGFQSKRTISPTFAKFDPATGDLEVYSADNKLAVGDSVMIDDGAITFRCSKDQYSSTHPYPRSTDPASGTYLIVKKASRNRFTVNVGSNALGGAISDQSIHVFEASNSNSIHVAPTLVKFDLNSITFNCTKDSNATNHPYPRADDPEAGHWLEVLSTPDANTFTVNVGISAGGNFAHTFVGATAGGLKEQTGWVTVNVGATPSTGHTVSTANFNPITGTMVLGIGNHYFNRHDNIRISPDSLTFTCGLDSNQTNHTYPRANTVVTQPTAASYDPETGYMLLTLNNHGYSNGDFVKFELNAFTFTCTMDNNGSSHTYPRATDPTYGKWLPVEDVQANTFKVHVGTTPTTGFEPISVSYNPTSGVMEMEIGEHEFTTDHKIRIAANSLTFRCAQDNYQTDHTYPRLGDPTYQTSVPIIATTPTTISVQVLASQPSTNTTTHQFIQQVGKTPTDINYNPNTGVMTVTIANHGYNDGDMIKIAENSLTFTCDKDSHASDHVYPRRTDPFWDKWMVIDTVTQDTFNVKVLETAPSTNTSTHIFKSCTANCITRSAIRGGGIYTHTNTGIASGGMIHKKDPFYQRGINIDQVGYTTHTVTNAKYNPNTGVMNLTIPNHGFTTSLQKTVTGATYDVTTSMLRITSAAHGMKNGDRVRIADNSLTFTCAQDSNATNHTYPRPSDPASQRFLVVTNASTNTFEVNVGNFFGRGPISNQTAHTFVSATADGLEVARDSIKMAENSITFTCARDDNETLHSYPRENDPSYNEYLPISNVGTNDFDVYVGHANLDKTVHQFVSATSNGIHHLDGTISINVGISSNTTTHNFVNQQTTWTPSSAGYNPTTGVMTLTLNNHKFYEGEYIYLADNAVTFRCDQDGQGSDHAYPRPGDPASGRMLRISNVTTNTFDVKVLDVTPSTNTTTHVFQSAAANSITKPQVLGGGVYDHKYVSSKGMAIRSGGLYTHVFEGPTKKTVTNASYLPATGIMTVTVPDHGWSNGDGIILDDYSLVFTCLEDSNNTEHPYPRPTDPFSNRVMTISNVTTDTFTVQVLASAPSTNTTTHTFVSATPHGIRRAAVHTGGAYAHTFISSQSNAITSYTGGGAARCSNEASAITTLMNIPINLFGSGVSNPEAYIAGINRTLPGEWPLTGERAAIRDLTITYDQAGNGECAVVGSQIIQLFNYPLNVIDTAAQGNGNWFTNQSVFRQAPLQNNTLQSGGGICYNVVSASNTLADMINMTLGRAPEMYRQAARLIWFNDQYIDRESYYKTMQNYGGYTGDETFSTNIRKALIYDLITDGNIKTLELVNSWFDAEGNFIAFPNIFRTYLLYHTAAVKDMVLKVLQQKADNPGPYNQEVPYENRELRPTETAQHKVWQLFHLIEVALNRSTLPTAYLKFQFNVGTMVNTDGSIDAPNGHLFQAYDRVTYTVLGSAIAELDKQVYFIHPDTTENLIWISEYIDGDKIELLSPGTAGQVHTLSVVDETGIHRTPSTFGERNVPTPISGGIQPADIFFGDTTGAYAEVIRIQDNWAKVLYNVIYLPLTVTSDPEIFVNGEEVVKTGATGNKGTILATDNTTYIKLVLTGGNIVQGDNIEGLTSGAQGTVSDATHKRILVNFRMGEFIATDLLFSKQDSGRANALIVRNNDGALLDNQSGRVTFDIETVTGNYGVGDVIYGSVTDQIIEVEAFNIMPGFGEYIHSTEITRFEYASLITDFGVDDTFKVGDVLQLQNAGQSVGHTFVVTEHDVDNKYVYLANEEGRFSAIGDDLTVIAGDVAYQLAKIPSGSNFPSVYTSAISSVVITATTAYGRIERIEQIGLRAIIHLGDASGTFLKNSQIIGDYGFRGACSVAKTLRGRVRRYFRGFDGVTKDFKLTENNGTAYFPDPAGHMMIFVNGILQPPGGNNAFTAFSDNIQFTEAPAINSTFHGVYVGKLRQLDDISFDFDSLRNSFNLKLGGVFYSLTLTEGVQSNTIRPENNIICQLNGVVQEPGIGFELVGSRIIFSEVPRAGSTFVAFSYIGSDVDVIAATVVPPIETGDKLAIEGEEFEREVALIESSNSLITFEYTGSVRGRNAQALANIERGRITEAILTNSGDGYTSRPQVDVISSSGFGGKIKALVGLARIDVKNAGQGYVLPSVDVHTTVDETFLGPTGAGVNGGIDIYDPNYIPQGESEAQGESYITIESQPVNTTVNQGQTASFTVIASTTPAGGVINYQWQKKDYGTNEWININGATSPTYTTPATTQGDGGDEFRVGLTSLGATPTLSQSSILTINIGSTTVDNFTPDQIFDDN